ncbi:hypothetical protein SUGI_0965460 [Cryptomeria japonica]|nr:hypothetical protein SUGI_0965460 [Cryptomeria japonica]
MEAKWVKTTRGYQSPNMCFLLDDEWSQAGLQLTDLSFIDSSFYGRSMALLKLVFPYIGVVAKFGEGCEVVAKHLQMHTDFEAITRLYKYLSCFQWIPNDEDSVKIWIPHGGCGDGGEWKDPEMCIIHDDGLINHKLHVLENIYEASLLLFFSIKLGVPVCPRVEVYCNVWLDYSSATHHVAETECFSVWKGILKYWLLSPSKVEAIMRVKGLKFPTENTSGQFLKLNAATDVVVPDDLKLTALFKGTCARNIFAWHPNPSNNEIPVQSLFSLYNSLGVKNMSEAVTKNEISISSDTSLLKLQSGEGIFGYGLYSIVLSYLAYPSFNITAAKRHAIVKTLAESSAYEIAEPMRISYILTLRTEDDNPKVRLSVATEFAEVVSKGLLSEHHPGLVAGLCELLKMGCMLEFDNEAVEEMLQHRNMQLFEEDGRFLYSQVFRISLCEVM